MEKCNVCLKEEKYCTCVSAHQKYPKHIACLQSATAPQMTKLVPMVEEGVKASIDPMIMEKIPEVVEVSMKEKEKKKRFWDKRH